MKTYEIEGLKFISRIYHERKVERINRFLDRIAPYVLLSLVFWVAYMYQLINALATLPIVQNILR